MLNPFKKNQILRQIFQEEKKLLEESRTNEQSGLLSVVGDERIKQRVSKIDALIEVIAPRDPLDWVSFMVRIGVAVLLFYVVIAPTYQYTRKTYLNPSLVSTASGYGTEHVTQYVPITATNITNTPKITQSSYNGPRSLDVSHYLDEVVAGVVARPKGGVTVVWTTRSGDRRVLVRQDVSDTLTPVGATSTIWGDVDLTGAATADATGTIAVIGTASIGGRPTLLMQLFGSDWEQRGNRVDIPLDQPNESLTGISIAPWGDGWAVLSEIVPPPGSSVLELRKTVIRRFTGTFALTFTKILKVETLNTDLFASFMPDPSTDGGFFILTNGALPIASPRDQKGDELYAMQFNADGIPKEYFRLTNNGRPHDFWVSSFFIDPLGNRFIAAHRINTTGFQPDNSIKSLYPTDTGQSIVYIFDKNWTDIGSVIAFQGGQSQPGDALIGVTHTRMVLVGKRLYTAFDWILTNDPASDLPTRRVQVKSFDLDNL